MSVLRDIRKEAGLSQSDFAALFQVDQTTVSKWERGISCPDPNLGLLISERFGVSLDKIYRNPLSFDTLSLPIHTDFQPNHPDRSTEERPETFTTNFREIAYFLENVNEGSSLVSDRDIQDSFLAIKVIGNSMEPRFCEGDIALILRGNREYDGQICAVCINGGAARIFRMTRHQNGVSLISLNPSSEPIFIPRSELERGKTIIVGRVVGLRARIR